MFGNIGMVWAYAGFNLLILSAVFRLSPKALEAVRYDLSIGQLIFATVFSIFMLYSEGEQGFRSKLCPRFVSRSFFLRNNPTVLSVLFAPFFSVGFFGATKKRMIISWAIFAMILALVSLVRLLDQPWRGLVDLGVVLGLTYGIGALWVQLIGTLFFGWEEVDPEIS